MQLDFDGTNFDTTATLTFSVAARQSQTTRERHSPQKSPVTPVKESVSASMVSPLTEATLNGSVVTLTLSGCDFMKRTYCQNQRFAVTVSGIEGVAVDTATVKRLGDRQISWSNLNYDGTDFVPG